VLTAGTALVTGLSASPAFAQHAARVEYSVDATCPGQDDFLARVRARTDRLERTTPDDEATPVYRVSATVTEGAAHGRLEMVDPSGISARDVDGVTCEDVVDALALVLALAIDPNASSAPIAPALAPPADALPAAAPPIAPAPVPPRLHVSGAAAGELTGGIAPKVLLGPTFYVEVDWLREDAAGSPESGRAVGPSLQVRPIVDVRLALSLASTSTTSSTVGSADFSWTVGRAEVCPVGAFWGTVAAMPCVRFDAGVLGATGRGVDVPSTKSRPWLAAGALARVRWTIARPIFVEVDGAVLAPIVRDHFYFARPQTTVYDVPAAGAEAGAAVGARFW
jgi:hypothetical protein